MDPSTGVPVSDGEVVVRRCTLRVVRRGGWSWGPAPQRLPQRIVDLLPELLAQRFADELTGEADVEITEPVTLVVRASLAGLARGAGPVAAVPAVVGQLPEPVSVLVVVDVSLFVLLPELDEVFVAVVELSEPPEPALVKTYVIVTSQLGRIGESRTWCRRLIEISPEDVEARALLSSLESKHS